MSVIDLEHYLCKISRYISQTGFNTDAIALKDKESVKKNAKKTRRKAEKAAKKGG